MIVSDIITRVRRSFGDESEVQVEDEDIIRWINDAQLEVLMHNENVLEEVSTMDLTEGQQEYAFPSNLYVLRSLRAKVNADSPYQYIKAKNLAEFDKNVDGWDGSNVKNNFAFIYTTYNKTIFLYPIPDRTLTDGLKLLYQKRPTEVVVSTDELDLPEEYHTSIVKYCMMEATVLGADYEASAIHQAQFMGGIRTLSNRNLGPNETYSSITVLPEDM